MSIKTLDECFTRFYIGTQHVQRRVEHPFQLRETDTARRCDPAELGDHEGEVGERAKR